MSYINPRSKILRHLDTLAAIQRGDRPAPINVEIDLSNRCDLKCAQCLTESVKVDIMGRGKRSIADVSPGEFVLSCDEGGNAVQWAQVYGTSKRRVAETIYRIAAAGNVIEATGEHPVFTRRGWVEAKHLTVADEVAYVRETMRLWLRSAGTVEQGHVSARTQQRGEIREEVHAEGMASVRLWVRAAGQDGRQQVLPRAQQYARIKQDAERTHESQQPHVAECGCGSDACDHARAGALQGGIGADACLAGEWDDSGSTAYCGGKAAGVRTHESQKSHARPGCCREGDADTARNREVGSKCRAIPALMANAGVSPDVHCAHEEEQPDAAHRNSGEVLERAATAYGGDQDGEMVCRTMHGEQPADLVFGTQRILGQGAQPGLQDSRPQTGDRNHRWVYVQEGGADGRELRIADYRALRGEQSCVSRGDHAGATAQVDCGFASRSPVGGAELLGYGTERGLDFCRVESITADEMEVAVYNLHTSTGTYFANDLLVHNCHFAYTHTRGPWANDAVKPAGHISGGDLMPLDLALSMLSQLVEIGVKSVTWTGGGEPTLHPHFDTIVRYAAELGLEQGIYTHGGHITESRAFILRELFSWVYISLDAHTRESYKAYKGVDRFDRVMAGIHRLVNAPGNATIGVGFLLSADNYQHQYSMVQAVRGTGVDYVQFRPMIQYTQDDPGALAEDTAWVTECLASLAQWQSDPFVIADMERFKQYRDWRGHGYPTCYWSAVQTVITPNGKVWRCTNKREHPDALLGDLTQESFADLWARSGGPCQVNAACRTLCRGHIANQTMTEVFRPGVHGNFV